ncbi:MAG: hypothetical protein M0R66_01160 [Candidatus Omnitrophica bacterium]|nr:hypothetical protein [Candidatus Omnitrophota bacterium]
MMDEAMKEEVKRLFDEAFAEANPDSIEIGSPSKGGVIKVYGNYARADEFKKKIEAAAALRKQANELIQGVAP